MDAVVGGFGVSSYSGRWLMNVAVFLGAILLDWVTSDIIMSTLLPPWVWCRLLQGDVTYLLSTLNMTLHVSH